MQTLQFLRKRLREALRLKLALRLVWKSAPKLTIANGVLILLQGPLPLLSLYVVKVVIDRVVTGISTPENPDFMQTAGVYLGLLIAIRLIESLVNSLATLVQETHTQVVTDYVSDVLHAKSIEVDLAYYEQAGYYDTLHRAQQEAAYRPVSILHNIIQLGRNSISLLAIVLSTCHLTKNLPNRMCYHIGGLNHQTWRGEKWHNEKQNRVEHGRSRVAVKKICETHNGPNTMAHGNGRIAVERPFRP